MRPVIALNLLLALVLAPFQHVYADGNANACAMLASASPNQTVIHQSGTVYTGGAQGYWSATAWESPSCIYSPRSADALARALKQITSANATFAIRGGGHSPLPGWSNINGGILILTSAIDDLEFNPSLSTVRAGMGNRWGALFEYLETFGRTVVGARDPHVGLATILGGGLSHSSNEHGFISDNIISFEVATTDGRLITVNATSNPNLFFALKAGTNNYGIVTHVTLRTYPTSKVWGGAIVYTNDHRDEVMRAFADYQRSGQLDTKSAVLSYMGINNNTIYVILVYLDDVERPNAFDAFYNIPSKFDGTSMHDNFTDLISQGLDFVVPRWTYGATTFLLDEATYVDVGRICQNATARLATINGGSMVLTPQPISASMVAESWKRGPNPMTTHLKHAAQMWLCLNMGWNFASDDMKIQEILLDTLASIDALTESRNLRHPFIFVNDAYMSQRPFASYGRDVVRALDHTRRETDPLGFFQQNVPGGFKLHQ